MAELSRGGNILLKEVPGLTHLTVGVQWQSTQREVEEDLMLGVLLCDQQGKVLEEEKLIFANQLATSAREVVMGADCQQVDIDLPAIPPQVERVDVVLWGNTLSRPLSQLSALVVRFLNAGDGASIAVSENLAPLLGEERALCLAQLYRYKGEWKVRVRGEGWQKGLPALLESYGVSTHA